MIELLENLFPVLITIIGIFYISIALILARAIGYKGLGFKIGSDIDDTCKNCLDKSYSNSKSNILFKKFNIKNNAIITIWLSFILGCLFLVNQITGYLDFLTSISIIGKLIIFIIFVAVGINARLLIKILKIIKKKCKEDCNEHFKINLIKLSDKIDYTSIYIYIIIVFITFFILFGQKALKKVSKKK